MRKERMLFRVSEVNNSGGKTLDRNIKKLPEYKYINFKKREEIHGKFYYDMFIMAYNFKDAFRLILSLNSQMEGALLSYCDCCGQSWDNKIYNLTENKHRSFNISVEEYYDSDDYDCFLNIKYKYEIY